MSDWSGLPPRVHHIYRPFQLAVGQDGVLYRQAVIFLSWWWSQAAPAQTWLKVEKRSLSFTGCKFNHRVESAEELGERDRDR